ncbi:MAG: hypothetical protein HQK55_12105 [Deltaproteobacteria bacterium]|nr:hypothetical protein [Deltaproteobacteria bacterium]
MASMDLYELKKSFNDNHILMCFAGPFSQSIIEDLGNVVKRYLEAAQQPKTSLMDVFSIFVEQTQNIRNYASLKISEGNMDCDFNSAIVIIGSSGDRHTISSGNIVDRHDIQQALDLLEMIKGLDKTELKTLYKKVIKSDRTSKGVGLGLIEMSRKASRPLQYSIQEINDRYCFFSLKATV